MAISDRLNKLTTDITNAYASIENKGGTIPANKNTDSLSTAIDSIEVIEQQTAEGESLSLTNTKAMPYSDYAVKGKSEQEGEPSPSIPSEIHSVADDVNLFDISKIETTGAITNNGNNTITITNSYSTSTTKRLSMLAPNLKIGETYILNLETTGTNKYIYLYGSNEKWDVGTTRTITQSDLDSYVFVYGENNKAVTISGIKIAKGTTLTPCSPYNQGTVTIKQRGTTESNDYVLQTSPLRSLPNGVKDTIEADGIHRRVGRVVLDGSENWSVAGEGDTTNGYSVYKDLIGRVQGLSATLLSNKFTAISRNNITSSSINFLGIGYANVIILNLDRTLLSEASTIGVKNWLSANNTEILYELKTEIIEPLTQNQATTMLDIIKTGSYEGTTNIYTDEDVKPTIGVGYYKKG